MRMNGAFPLAAALVLVSAAPAEAQLRVAAQLGATGSSSLVNDVIIVPLEVSPGLAPTVLLSASLPVNDRLRAGLDLGYARSPVHVNSSGALAQDFGSLGALTAALALIGPIRPRLDWRLSLGVLKYLPSNDVGVFVAGVPTAALFGAGVDWRQPLSSGWTGVASARYDVHLFSTPALEAAGFSGSQQVSRVTVAVGAAWEWE